jgi:hypothetical protein
VGGFVRKGLWIPLPAFEFGAGALSILNSRMYVLQGYAKLALQEGFTAGGCRRSPCVVRDRSCSARRRSI